MAEGARLESVFAGNRNAGSNPAPSARNSDNVLSYLAFLQWPSDPLPRHIVRTAKMAGKKPRMLACRSDRRAGFSRRAAFPHSNISGAGGVSGVQQHTRNDVRLLT